MSTDPDSLRCWKCGAGLKTVPRPFSRFAECPECRIELHVCRMCRHYDTKYVGQCNHDFADKVLHKDKSNFCAHFRPDPGAYQGADDTRKQQAEEALQSLFGHGGGVDDTGDEEPESEEDAARKRLRDLFDER